MRLLVPAIIVTAVCCSLARGHHDELSRHFIAEALPVTDVVVAAAMTAGPFFEAVSDFVVGSDMVAAARAGAGGGAADRAEVVDGILLSLTLNLFQVSPGATEAFELEGAEVFLWHCDAVGLYSAAPELSTAGQRWLRGLQTTPANGSVTFRTILPGWYPGRALHFHLRVRQPGSANFAVTTQLFLSDAFVSTYQATRPYSQHAAAVTPLTSDGIFMSVPAAVREKLVLNCSGSQVAGFNATFNLGIQVDSIATATTTSSTLGTTVGPAMTVDEPVTAPATAASLLGPILPSAAVQPSFTLTAMIVAVLVAWAVYDGRH